MQDFAQKTEHKSRAICILGMHRSGTSSIAGALNFLGVYLGDPAVLAAPGPDNAKGFWENPDLRKLQQRLLASLNRTWHTVQPLPPNWMHTEAILPLKRELADLITAGFAGHPLWGWKDPQTCLLLPLWRELLKPRHTDLACLFIVRNPADVAASLAARNGIPFEVALGIWLHYNVVALRDAAGLPIVFLGYENFLARWELELRRCAAGLGLAWPQEEAKLRKQMNGFIDPKLRHHHAPRDRLQTLPAPVRELYSALTAAADTPAARREPLEATVRELADQFHAYASFFQPIPQPPVPPWPARTLRRWRRSIQKRLPKASA